MEHLSSLFAAISSILFYCRGINTKAFDDVSMIDISHLHFGSIENPCTNLKDVIVIDLNKNLLRNKLAYIIPHKIENIIFIELNW